MTAICVQAPASKSLTHRYLMGAALAEGESIVRHTLESGDVMATRGILQELGAEITPWEGGADALRVRGIGGKVHGGQGKALAIDVGESGTTCRLMCAVLASGEGLFCVSGRERMHLRPVRELCGALAKLGADIAYQGTEGCPPLLIQANGLHPELLDGGPLTLSMDDSSQYFSGLLLAAPQATRPLRLELGGNKAVSWPYVGLTLQCLADFGIDFVVETRPDASFPWQSLPAGAWRELRAARPGCLCVTVQPGQYRAGNFVVEGDWSGASYFLAAGAVGAMRSRAVCVRGLSADSLQGDRALVDILRAMGASVDVQHNEQGDDAITVTPAHLHGATLDMGFCPDLVPTVAVLAALAGGDTHIHNVAHLRIKESDRIEAPIAELRKVGVVAEPLADGMLVHGIGTGSLRALQPGQTFCSHNDHRIAMSLALLQLREPDMDVRALLDAPQVVAKSFPDFWERWSMLL